jgi:hypothetical protein
MYKNLFLQIYLVPLAFLILNGIFLNDIAQSSIKSNLPSLELVPNRSSGYLVQQNVDSSKPTKEEKNSEKEIKKEEKDLEKEAKNSCDISGNLSGGKSKKCEPSIYEQAYPDVDFQSQDEKITEHLIKELEKDSRFKDKTIVK